MVKNNSNSNQNSGNGNQSGTNTGNTGQQIQNPVIQQPIPSVPQQDRTVIEKGDGSYQIQK